MLRRCSKPTVVRLEDRCQPASLTWTGLAAPNLNWSEANNWNTKTTPMPGDSVLFTTVTFPGSAQSVVDQAFAVAELLLDANWGAGLTLNGALTIGGGTWASGVIIGAAGSLTNNGTFLLPGAVGFQDGGTLTNNGTITMSGFTWTIGLGKACTVENNGTLNIASADDLQLIQFSKLNNNATGIIDFKTSVNIEPPISVQPGTLTNAGVIRKSGPGTSLLRANLTSSGTIDVQSGQLDIVAATINGGKLQASTGATLDLTNSFGTSLSGDIAGSGSGKVVIDEGVTLLGDTSLNFKGGLLRWSGGSINANDYYMTLPFENALVLDPAMGKTLTLNGPGKFINEGTISHTGDGNLAVDKGIVIENTGDYEFQSNGDIGIGAFGPAPSILNSGFIRKVAGSLISFVNVSMSGTGDFDVQIGELELRLPIGSVLTDPTMNVAANAILDLTGGVGFTTALIGSAVGSGLGKILFNGGTLALQENTTLDFADDLFEWAGGVIDTKGKMLTNIANRFVNITSGAVHNLIGGGKFVNQGTIRHMGSGNVLFNTAGTLLENVANYVFESSGDIGTSVAGIGEVINKGLIRKLGTGIAQVNVKLTGDGDFDIQVGQLQLRLPVGSLVTNPTLTVNAGATLDLAGAGTVFAVAGTVLGPGPGAVLLSGGSLFVDSAAILDFADNVFQWNGGAINTNGQSLTNAVGRYINVGAASLVELIGSGTFFNEGTIRHTGTGDLRLEDAGTALNNIGEYVFEAAGSITSAVAGIGTMINDGLIRKITAGLSELDIVLISKGSFDIKVGELQLGGNGNSLLLGANINVEAGAKFDLTGGATVKCAGEIAIKGGGEVVLSSGTLSLNGGTMVEVINGNADIRWTGGTIKTNGFVIEFIDTDLYLEPAGLGTVNLSGGGTLANYGNIFHNGAGDLRINDAGTTLLNLEDGNYELNNGTADITFAGVAGQFVNQGLLSHNAIASTSIIATTFNNSGTLRVQQGAVSITGAVTQIAGAKLTGGEWLVFNGSALNFSVPVDNNQAKVRLDGVGASFTNFFLDFNSGTFELTGGCDFANSFGLNNSGVIILGPASTLTTTGKGFNTGTITVQIDGSPASGNFGVWNTTGAMTFGGTLVIQRPNGFVPIAGSTYKIHAYPSRTLDYANVSGLVVAPMLVFDRIVNTGDMVLALGAATAPIAKVASVVVNDGSAQRSNVTLLKVTFDQVVSFLADPTAAITFTRLGPTEPPFSSMTGSVTLTDITTHSGQTIVTLTFSGPLTEAASKSLIDGRYELRVLADQVANFDGDGNGIVGDDYVFTGTLANGLFRLFGDVDGNGLIDLIDFGAFRIAFGTNSTIFSFEGSGPVDLADFGQFRTRFGMGV